MKKAWLRLWPVLVMALIAGCDKGGSKAVTPSATPAGADTGLREVGAVVRFVLAADVGALLALTSYVSIECTTQLGLGGPPLCSNLGVPPGTVVETLPVTGSESEYRPKDRVPEYYRRWLYDFGLEFGGVLKPERHPRAFTIDSPWPVPDYAVFFRPTIFPPELGAPDAGLAVAFFLLDGRIIAVQGLGAGQRTLPAPDDPRWLIPPVR